MLILMVTLVAMNAPTTIIQSSWKLTIVVLLLVFISVRLLYISCLFNIAASMLITNFVLQHNSQCHCCTFVSGINLSNLSAGDGHWLWASCDD